MEKIRKLSAELIGVIAAGQVVERPSSVVKELVENSLDAQAKNITIKIFDGGKQEIVIIDDGIGMSSDDVLLAIQPHSTSKITNVNDLSSLTSFGFRGEALASIALVSRFSLQSKELGESLGYRVSVKFGKQIDHHQVGMGQGTVVRVAELFRFLPARQKFLKSGSIELQQILKELLPVVLQHCTVRFRLEHNAVELFDCPAGQSFLERLMLLHGEEYSASLLPVHHNQAGYTITGYIGVPQIASPTRAKQQLWVNKRSVQHHLISRVIKSQYSTLLEPRALPVYFLSIQADPGLIDSNVHPRKESVAFAEEDIIVGVLATAIKSTLETNNLLYSVPYGNEGLSFRDSGMDPVIAGELKRTVEPWSVKNFSVSPTSKFFQLHKLYIFLEVDEGVLLIDQHAAHERILYEQFLEGYQQHLDFHVITLAQPERLQLSVFHQALLEQKLEILKQLGIYISQEAEEFYIISIPRLLQHRNYKAHILDILEQEGSPSGIEERDTVVHQTIAYLACRSAIKAGEPLTQDEQKNVVEKLLATTSNYTCPHGRPVMIHLSMAELDDWFKRSGF